MRIAIFTPVYFPIVGGVTITVDQLHKAGISRGDSVLIVAPVGSVGEESAGADIVRVCIPDHPTLSDGPLCYLRAEVLRRRARFKIARLLEERRIDIIHIQFPIPRLHSLIPSHLPLLITYQGSDVLQLYEKTGPYLDDLNSRAGCITAVSGGLLTELLDMRPHLMDKAARVFNGKPSADEIKGLEMPLNGKQRYVVFVGDLKYRKGPDQAIRAFAGLPSGSEHFLYMAGDGPERARLAALAESLGVAGKVKFLGTLNRIDTLRYIRNADLLVFPSRREGLGIVILEAMSVGCPVVASGISACAGMVKHGLNGYLFEPENTAEMAECIWRIITDESHRAKLSGASLQTASSYPTWDEVYQQYRSKYEEIIANHAS